MAICVRNRRTGGRLHAEFPLGPRDDVTFGPSRKALTFMPASGSDTGGRPAAEFFREATTGRPGMPGGLVRRLGREVSAKSAPEREEAIRALMTSPIMHADLANAMVGGKQKQVPVLANGSGTRMMIPRGHKGHEGVKGTPLDAYARTADALARALKAAGITVDETDIPDDVEVFEFGGEDDDIVFEFLPDNE